MNRFLRAMPVVQAKRQDAKTTPVAGWKPASRGNQARLREVSVSKRPSDFVEGRLGKTGTREVRPAATGRDGFVFPPQLQLHADRGTGGERILRREPTQEAAPGGGVSPLVQKFIDGKATAAEKAEIQKQLASGKMPAADFEALKAMVAGQLADGIMKLVPPAVAAATAGAPAPQAGGGLNLDVRLGGGSFTLNTGADTGAALHTFFKAGLRVKLSGGVKAVAGGLDGTVETVIEVDAAAAADTGTVTIAPPQGDTALAANIRAQAFPSGPIVLTLPAGALKALRMSGIKGTITLTVAGKDATGDGIVIGSPDVPAGVALVLSLSQSSDRPVAASGTGASALPPPSVFATAGGGSVGGHAVGATTVGFDAPLLTDTKNPWIYGGVGLRASADSSGSLAGSGALIVGAHISPVTLQAALTAGAGREGADGKIGATFGAEGSVGYKFLQHAEVVVMYSVIGGKDQPAANTVQAGVGYSF